MGMISEKAKFVGLFGGVATSKEGRHFMFMMKPGKWAPFLDKVETPKELAIPAGVVFGTPIELSLTNAEQKFADFNSSFSFAETAVIHVVK